MLYLPILVPKFWQEIIVPKYMQKGWGGTRGNTPGIGILTTGKEIVPKLDVSCEGGRGSETPLWNILMTYQSRIILNADKGTAMEVIARQGYNCKALVFWMIRTLTDTSSRTQLPNTKVNSSTYSKAAKPRDN